MPTLPEEIADLVDKLYKVCETYKVESITLTQYLEKDENTANIEIIHPLGKVILSNPSFFQMPEDSGKIAPALSAGISRLVDRYRRELNTAQSDLESAKDEIARCEESIERASALVPGILDQIVAALE